MTARRVSWPDHRPSRLTDNERVLRRRICYHPSTNLLGHGHGTHQIHGNSYPLENGNSRFWPSACCTGAGAADFTLTPAEAQRVANREIVIRASLDPNKRKGTVRAAIQIDAAPAIVFGMMTRCADALRYVPHLKDCRVRDRAPDDSWQLIEHEIDFGWYTPRLRWIFRVDFIGQTAMHFRQVSGDFKANEGMWELEPAADGTRTLLRYRVYIDPPGYRAELARAFDVPARIAADAAGPAPTL